MMDVQFMAANISLLRCHGNSQCDTIKDHNCDMETFGTRLRQARKEAKLSQPALAKKVGLSQTTISDIERGRNSGSTESASLAAALGVEPLWLAEGRGPKHRAEGNFIDSTARRVTEDNLLPLSDSKTSLEGGESLDQNAEPAGRPRAPKLVKIRGFAKLGGDGYYEEIECDGWVESYSPDPDAYGLRVKGDSMHPAIRNGQVVVIEPNGQLVLGEYVAIALADGRKMVKELVFDRQDEIVVESVNGNHRQTIERQDIQAIHPVSAIVPASKWRAE